MVSGRDPGSRSLTQFLRDQAFDVVWAHEDESAHQHLDEQRVDCLVTELRAPGVDGFDLLRHGLSRNPDLCAVVVAGPDQVALALEAMREGAYDFQFRPIHFEKLLAVLDRGLRHQRLAARMVEMEDRLDERLALERFAGISRGMERVRDQIRQMTASRGTVLIEGESGTGRSLAAQALHHHSPARDQPLLSLSFARLSPAEAEAELFGVESADASAPRIGMLEQAEAGTVILEDVAETSAAIQVRLLRLIQDREFERVGSRRTRRSQARLVATSARDLVREVEAGRFRRDLHQRLSAVRLWLPPLRERLQDIPLLVEMFVRDAGARGRRVTGVTPGLLDALARYPWPGNVAELRSVVEGMIAGVDRRRALDVSDLPIVLEQGPGARERLRVTVGMTVEEVERALIQATLRHTEGDKTRAAAMLGIGLRTLYRRIQALGLG